MFPQGGNVTEVSNFPFPSSLQNMETRYFVLCVYSILRILNFNWMLWNMNPTQPANTLPVLVRRICLKIRTFHTSLFFRISRGQTLISRGCCLQKTGRREKDTQGMESGGDVSCRSLPIHELLVPFSRLGGLTRNPNSSPPNSAFAFNDHTEKRNTNSLLIFIFGYSVFHFTLIHFILK